MLWTSAALPVAVPRAAAQGIIDAGVEITDCVRQQILPVAANAMENVEGLCN